MKNNNITAVFLLVLCACAKVPVTNTNSSPETAKVTYTQLSLKESIAAEKAVNAKDISTDYQAALKQEFYPNKKKYPLAKPQTFLRTESPWFSNRVEYYYDSRDSSVKAIVYEWNELTENNRMDKKEVAEKLLAFRNKFKALETHIVHQLGSANFMNLESNRLISAFTDEEKWMDLQGMNVSLALSGNKENGYGQIRLVVYKD